MKGRRLRHSDSEFPDEECGMCVDAIRNKDFVAIDFFGPLKLHSVGRSRPDVVSSPIPSSGSVDVYYTTQREFYPSIVDHYRQLIARHGYDLAVEVDIARDGSVWVVNGNHRLIASLLEGVDVGLIRA